MLEPLLREAHALGAELISLPEATNLLRQDKSPEHFHTQQDDPCVRGVRRIARELSCWIHLGSALLKESDKLVNRSLLLNAEGEVAAAYDKMHLFKIRHNKLDIDEGRQFSAGRQLVCADTPWGKLGLSICYDLRYPLMYRRLCAMGAVMLAVPSAFTRVTGKAHWRSLLRARAIENACFIFAAAQGGKHEDGRSTHGHSMIIDPWGKVIAEAKGENPQVIVARLAAKTLTRARTSLNAWAEENGLE